MLQVRHPHHITNSGLRIALNSHTESPSIDKKSYIWYPKLKQSMNTKLFLMALAIVAAFSISTVVTPVLAQNATGNATTAGGDATGGNMSGGNMTGRIADCGASQGQSC